MYCDVGEVVPTRWGVVVIATCAGDSVGTEEWVFVKNVLSLLSLRVGWLWLLQVRNCGLDVSS